MFVRPTAGPPAGSQQDAPASGYPKGSGDMRPDPCAGGRCLAIQTGGAGLESGNNAGPAPCTGADTKRGTTHYALNVVFWLYSVVCGTLAVPTRGSAVSTLDVTAEQLATLRATALREAADTLDRVAGELALLGASADVSDPLGDVAVAIRVVREDLDALEALGYR